jgi:hypothetical protein
MSFADFKEYCKQSKFDEALIEQSIEHVSNFQKFLKRINKDINAADDFAVKQYAKFLIKAKKNTKETYYALIRYSFFSNNKQMRIALYELLDGSDVIQNLSKQAEEKLGEKEAKELFSGILIPQLGTAAEKKPQITKKLIERLMDICDEETTHQILIGNLHGISKENYKTQRKLFLKSKTIDEYLKIRRINFIKLLEKHLKDKTLFFTQEIDQKVIDFIKNNPRIEGGERKGKILFVEKIPYLTKKYLEVTDENMKKYYYCHCSWVREALKKDEPDIPAKFCDCSAGFYKNQWEAILKEKVQVETIETILKGDKRCLFAIHLPEGSV